MGGNAAPPPPARGLRSVGQRAGRQAASAGAEKGRFRAWGGGAKSTPRAASSDRLPSGRLQRKKTPARDPQDPRRVPAPPPGLLGALLCSSGDGANMGAKSPSSPLKTLADFE
ncbi:hypothetical protein E2320_014184 [Naja naja]|nr:hypothetical protein E2320_014184 [Naja naja]